MWPADVFHGQNAPGTRTLAQVPEGLEACLITRLFHESPQTLLVVVRHKERLDELSAQLNALDPDLPLLIFPAWDTLAYDRVSPRKDLMGTRLATLKTLHEGKGPFLVLTTCGALLQRVPPQSLFAKTTLTLQLGQSLPEGRLEHVLAAAGYLRVETVREPGEYAVRGSLVDLFPAHADLPRRIDRFGTEIETIKTFDPLTQRSQDTLKSIEILPVTEVVLSPDTISQFRQRYREAFGVPKALDTLYNDISEGRPHGGMEHWLPFFYDELPTLFDVVGAPSRLFLGADVPLGLSERIEAIEDYYQARKNTPPGKEQLYHPVPVDSLFLSLKEIEEHARALETYQTNPYDVPKSDQNHVISLGAKPFLWAHSPQETLLKQLSHILESAKAQSKTLFLAWQTQRERLTFQEMLKSLECPYEEADTPTFFTRVDVSVPCLVPYPVSQSFEDDQIRVVSASQLMGKMLTQRARRKKRSDLFIEEACALSAGDLVVHQDHGVGRYQGLVSITVGGKPHDCLQLEYAGQDRLFLPVENLDLICRYGGEASAAALDKLGTNAWRQRKEKIKKDLFAIASHLLETAAKRELLTCEPLVPDEALYTAFCQRFDHAETDDQLRTLDETLEDLASGHPMDRLVCGDVGFGKTEIALRAACVAASAGKQVALIAPTTLLVRQHFLNFKKRFEGLGIRVAQLSRFVSATAAKKTKEDIANGKVHVVIATHALLARSVTFQDLGLLIVDEEQHFGVKQKEKLKSLNPQTHLLTLSATPIPRTLQMALTGMRSLSLITTPPMDRLPVRTFVTPFDPVVIKEAILRERARGGQTFFVCPRLKDLDEVKDTLLALIPDLRVTFATGQMAATDLEKAMTAFCDREVDVLLSTNIIESGLDLPFVNTIIVHRSDLFGLSQLYQLRGRVGRAKARGYAYLTLPTHKPASESATKRLEVMQTLDTLGAGFQLASHDMDLRGTGNLLGEEQSGHIKEVGLELYQQMLEDAVLAVKAKARGEEIAEKWSPQMSLGLPVMLPPSYIPDLGVRLNFYRRLSWATTKDDLKALYAESVDRFGAPPEDVTTLFEVMGLKQLCKQAGVAKIDVGDRGMTLAFFQNTFAAPTKLITYVLEKKGVITVRPDQSLVIKADIRDPKAKLKLAHKVLRDLVGLLPAKEDA